MVIKPINLLKALTYKVKKQDKRKKFHSFTEKNIAIFTDASVSPYGGPACIGWVQKGSPETVKFELVKEEPTSVQFLEAKAIARAILKNDTTEKICIYSDSQVGIRIIKTIFSGKNYHEATVLLGTSTVNAMVHGNRRKTVQLIWVKAHQENDWNVICDQLVRYGRNRLKAGASIEEVNHEAQGVLHEMMRVRELK